ncbi:hypothetical protein Belba_1432 [Belliella baltica DSM 15883]|uniref:Seryl-tRNA synthetase n=1 Tax=Belliella baltica (strain DSM 15883 / CIP 108006 / LMG 21964 / BA134) TaxID=866536 RepID=I3Z483_BELBD|nr:seryl-tRNA synthetase [Belliella baltica]AFL84051.1 hypothetical protein Belba_1432 [Belliella baltica DSM 15883]
MKKIAYFLSIMFLFLAYAPIATASDTNKEKSELTVEEQERLDEINNRVEEIKAMDFADMSKAERKEVRNELKEMREEAKALGNGVYLSVGAIIIILLILILLT